jgi:hypothetical protein
MEHENEIIRPPQILLKPSWAKQLEYLSIKDKATIFTNLFRYYYNEPLEKMNPMAAMFFSSFEEVMTYNSDKYQKTVEKNRENGSKSKGRPTKKPSQTQDNPVGTIENPENPKDKARDKSNSKSIVNTKSTLNTKAALNQQQEEIIETKLLQLLEQDWSHIKNQEEAAFVQSCKVLADEVSWERFIFMLIKASREELQHLITMFNISISVLEILELRRHCFYYLNKLLPQLP